MIVLSSENSASIEDYKEDDDNDDALLFEGAAKIESPPEKEDVRPVEGFMARSDKPQFFRVSWVQKLPIRITDVARAIGVNINLLKVSLKDIVKEIPLDIGKKLLALFEEENNQRNYP